MFVQFILYKLQKQRLCDKVENFISSHNIGNHYSHTCTSSYFYFYYFYTSDGMIIFVTEFIASVDEMVFIFGIGVILACHIVT